MLVNQTLLDVAVWILKGKKTKVRNLKFFFHHHVGIPLCKKTGGIHAPLVQRSRLIASALYETVPSWCVLCTRMAHFYCMRISLPLVSYEIHIFKMGIRNMGVEFSR